MESDWAKDLLSSKQHSNDSDQGLNGKKPYEDTKISIKEHTDLGNGETGSH